MLIANYNRGIYLVGKMLKVHTAWARIVAIAAAHTTGGDFVGMAITMSTLYAYQMGPVLFKPLAISTNSVQPSTLHYLTSSHQMAPVQKTRFAIKAGQCAV